MMRRIPIRWWLAPAALVLALPLAAQPRAPRPEPAAQAVSSPRVVEEKSGTLATRAGQRLRLATDLGHVRIRTVAAGAPLVRYRVSVEAQPGQPEAEQFARQFRLIARSTHDGAMIKGQAPGRHFRGRLRVNFDLEIPRQYSVEVSTNAGNIELGDLHGRAALSSLGGNITAGEVGGAARFETMGGHITVRDVAGDLSASTAGGHITAGNVGGDAILESSGGHVRVGRIAGLAQLQTGGGNIFVERAGSRIVVTTAGGRIDIGEVSGAVQARTGGGGIRVLRVSGPTELESAGGGIFLSRIQGPVRALTASGGITAWFAPEAKITGASVLECRQGDLVVFLPREIPLTIQATIETPGDHRFEADPALNLNVKQVGTGGARSLRAEADLHGGGEVLKLHTVAGNIKLRFADATKIFEQQLENQLRMQLQQIEQQLGRQRDLQIRALERFRMEVEAQAARSLEEAARRAPVASPRFFERLLVSRVRVPAEEQRQRLVQMIHPAYPEIARRARIEGRVRLQVLISREGKVEEVKVLSGHSLLAQAAADAVRGWRYEPLRVNEKEVPVMTTVDVEFKLN
jgi:TonB family protein